MPEAGELTDLGIAVTRPARQAEGLARLLQARGARVIRFPVLEIAPPADREAARQVVARLGDFDLGVFISANAVLYGLDLIGGPARVPPGLRLAAVGKATAGELERKGLMVGLAPEGRYDSEALLDLEDLQPAAVAGRRVLIFRGEGGRELLADTLRGRGAVVEYAQVYRRVRPQIDPALLCEPLARGEIDLVVVSSGEGLGNLFRMVGSAGAQRLRATPLVLISERMAEAARGLGCTAPFLLARRADDDAVVEAIAQWAGHGRVFSGYA